MHMTHKGKEQGDTYPYGKHPHLGAALCTGSYNLPHSLLRRAVPRPDYSDLSLGEIAISRIEGISPSLDSKTSIYA